MYWAEERISGGTVWVAIRARGAEWSWLTPDEAARIGREWVERYGSRSEHVKDHMHGYPKVTPEIGGN
jgi:hypothetical protein